MPRAASVSTNLVAAVDDPHERSLPRKTPLSGTPLDQGRMAARRGPAKNTGAPALAGACRNVHGPNGREGAPR
jgi:hypothetical protein